MDTITHGIVGALVGKALFAGRDTTAGTGASAEKSTTAESSGTARVAIAACTLGSIFPDIDIIAGPIARNPLAIMEWHRSLTHSIVMLPVWAVLLAAVSLPLARWLRWESPPFAKLAAIYGFGIATHIFLDLATSFGTMVWSPISYSRVSWDWLFIVDLTFTAIALLPQLAAWCYREPAKFAWRSAATWFFLILYALGAYVLGDRMGYGFPMWVVVAAIALMTAILFIPAIMGRGFHWTRTNWCRAGLAAVCVYIALAAAAHHRALADVKAFAGSRDLSAEHIAALPLPPTFTHWTGVIRMPAGVWRTSFHVPGDVPEQSTFYADAAPDRYIAVAKALPHVQVYLWFARFPVYQEFHESDGSTRVFIGDATRFRGFESGQDENASRMGRGFTYEVDFNASGQVVKDGFARPSSE